MTKFDSVAIGHRKAGAKGGGEAARQRELEEFKKTGVHPEQRATRDSAAGAPVPLPPPDPSRPHLALDLALDGRPLGRAVVEVFEDAVPLAAAQLLRRCAPGSPIGLAGSAASRLIRLSAVHWPAPAAAAAAAASGARPALDTNAAARRTRFSCAGLVGVARDGSGAVAVSLGRALTLDATHVVVGRVGRWIGGGAAAVAAAAAMASASGDGGGGDDASGGREFAAALNAVRTNAAGDAPAGRLLVGRCGRSDARGGAADDAAGGGAGAGAGAAAAAKPPPAPSAKELRAGVDEALREGLLKRGPAAAAGGGGGAAPAAKRRTMLSALSGSEDDDSSSSSSGDEEEEKKGGGGGSG